MLALAGLMQALSMGLPEHLGPSGVLQWIGMLVLAAMVNHACTRPRQVALYAFVFQFTALLATVWWLFIALHVYGEMPVALSVLGIVLLCAGLSLYWALFAWGYAFIWGLGKARSNAMSSKSKKANLIPSATAMLTQAFAFGASWTLAELARGVWFTGFPWGSSGYAHTDTWLGQLASWVGVYALGWISASLAMGCVLMAQSGRLLKSPSGVAPVTSRGQQWGLAVLAILMSMGITVSLAWGPEFIRWFTSAPNIQSPSSLTPRAPTLSVTLLQGNVPQESKFTQSRDEAALWYREHIAHSESDLVITPETAFARPPQSYAGQFFPSLVTLLLQKGRFALIGMPLVDNQGYTNSAVGVGQSAQEVYRYDKAHLVPFGEFVPPFFQWFTDHLHMPLGFFRRGQDAQPAWSILGERIAPNICYEDLFGEELAKQFVNPAQAPTLMVNMSNIAWFGDTVVVDQHLQISRMRALELHRPMLRSTNSGATVAIDENANVISSLPSFSQGELTLRLSGVHEGVTFFAWWAGHFGLWPLWLACAGALALFGLWGHIGQKDRRGRGL